MQITVKLYASLSEYLPKDARREHSLCLEFSESATLSTVVDSMQLPRDLIHLVLLNGVYVEPEARAETPLSDGDAVAVWPPIAGG